MHEKLLDDTGWRILEELQGDARLSYKELGRRVNLSTPAVIERVRRMEEAGILEGYRGVVNPQKVGYAFRVILAVATVYNNPDHVILRTLAEIPEGIPICNVESQPEHNGQFARSSGVCAILIAHDVGQTVMQLPSDEMK